MPGGRGGAGVLAAGAVAVAVLVGGCGASAGDAVKNSDGVAQVPPAPAAAADGAAASAGDGKAAVGGAAVPALPGTGAPPPPAPSAVPTADTRMIAYTAQVTLRSDDVAKTLAEARTLAEAAGGYVSKESANGTGGAPGGAGGAGAEQGRGPNSGQIVLKVPSAAYQRTVEQLAGLGEVLSRNSQADDLTQQVVDVASRVQSQQASVERVRALMAQAKSLADIVSLEGELSRRQADLESLLKQQQELTARTSLSTVTLDVRSKAAPAPPEPGKKKEGFWAAVGSALGGGWHVLTAIVRGLLIALAAIMPFLLVLAPAGGLFWLLTRRRAALRPAVPGPGSGPDADLTEELGPQEPGGDERREAEPDAQE
ncbi:DUF4349 domain-containing protein [Kitasatospora sp. NPDC050543]|uniref:DUF4349 domain-containing protein n=1 Tax=Kitasatospora sp. NPDC050543 TaxID=3364054 RepID=UPI00378F1D18